MSRLEPWARRAHWLVGVVFLLVAVRGRGSNIGSQTAQVVLDRQFPETTLSFLILDARSGMVLAERWPDAAEPIPIGSLIKPFTAMAWAATARPFPEVDCHGKQDACWLPRGHGRMTLQAAITQSCNAYFLALGRDLSVGEANATLGTYGLPPVSAADKAMALAGLSPSWQVRPRALAAAYLRLESDASRNRFQPLLKGMRESAASGTARAVSAALPATAVLAKTGTAPCRHTPRAMADGFTVIFFPAEDPRLFLLVREHGVTGAVSAAVAGRMLRALEAGDK
jgi:cell division protein FtsI/penicillin-binding protein 2